MIYFAIALNSFMIGLLMAAPPGPITVLTIERSITKSAFVGLYTGLGCSVVHMIYAVATGLNVGFFTYIYQSQKVWFQLIGIVVLSYLGIKSLLTKPKNRRIFVGNSQFFTTFFISITNPLSFPFFLSLISAFDLLRQSPGLKLGFILIHAGLVLAGSASWWLILCAFTYCFKKKINDSTIILINKISGGMILIFALSILINILHEHI